MKSGVPCKPFNGFRPSERHDVDSALICFTFSESTCLSTEVGFSKELIRFTDLQQMIIQIKVEL